VVHRASTWSRFHIESEKESSAAKSRRWLSLEDEQRCSAWDERDEGTRASELGSHKSLYLTASLVFLLVLSDTIRGLFPEKTSWKEPVPYSLSR